MFGAMLLGGWEILLVLLILGPLALLCMAFWVWMLVDAIKNRALSDTEKLVWVLSAVGVVNVTGFDDAMAGVVPIAGASSPFELNPVFAMGDNEIGFGDPRTVFVAAEIATKRPSRWSSCPSSRNYLPARS